MCAYIHIYRQYMNETHRSFLCQNTKMIFFFVCLMHTHYGGNGLALGASHYCDFIYFPAEMLMCLIRGYCPRLYWRFYLLYSLSTLKAFLNVKSSHLPKHLAGGFCTGASWPDYLSLSLFYFDECREIETWINKANQDHVLVKDLNLNQAGDSQGRDFIPGSITV